MKKITMRSNQVIRQSINLEEAFGQFIKMCTLKNLSPKTIETYTDPELKLLGFCMIIFTATRFGYNQL
jgi:hypothetical protein